MEISAPTFSPTSATRTGEPQIWQAAIRDPFEAHENKLPKRYFFSRRKPGNFLCLRKRRVDAIVRKRTSRLNFPIERARFPLTFPLKFNIIGI